MTDIIQQVNFDKPLEGIESPTRRLKVAWLSDHFDASSGYAQQSYDIRRKFLESGWNGSNLSFIHKFGQMGFINTDRDGIRNYPSMVHPQASDAAMHHSRHFGADVLFHLLDIWMQNPQDLAQIPYFIPWIPIDYDPVPTSILTNLRFANRIIAMSKFGQKQLQNAGFSSIYIPHHVDTKIFRPLDKKALRDELHLPQDLFIFGMVAANKDLLPRKSFGHVLLAFQRFLQKNPNSILYIHSTPDHPPGYPIRQHAQHLGIQDKVVFPDQYKMSFDTSKEDMNKIYNTFDAYLMPSSTEGFGITAIEAQACGVPVIVNNYTSMPELVSDGETGYIVKKSDDCHHFMAVGGEMWFPNIEDLYNKMVRLKGMKLDVMGKAARKHILANYDLDMLWEKSWLPLLEKLEKEKYPQVIDKPAIKAIR